MPGNPAQPDLGALGAALAVAHTDRPLAFEQHARGVRRADVGDGDRAVGAMEGARAGCPRRK
jgi:hypothetical protein